jgi:hypothetical protein
MRSQIWEPYKHVREGCAIGKGWVVMSIKVVRRSRRSQEQEGT